MEEKSGITHGQELILPYCCIVDDRSVAVWMQNSGTVANGPCMSTRTAVLRPQDPLCGECLPERTHQNSHSNAVGEPPGQKIKPSDNHWQAYA